MTISSELEEQDFEAINGGPYFPFTKAISLAVNCESQKRDKRAMG
jgi:predicted 3-demethylubiquinone-9 3-methyltransferase (glyoxalase superfamily)